MDSLDDILNRVLQKSAEKVAQRVQPTMNRRPLRDPETNSIGFFQDVSAAVKNIRSPEVVSAMRSHAGISGSQFGSGGENGVDGNEPDIAGASSSSAERSRRTTLADDVSIIGQMTSSVSQVVRQIATAGKAIGEFSGNTGKLDKAVSGMTRTVVDADKGVKSNNPVDGFTRLMKGLFSRSSGGAAGGAGSGGGNGGSDGGNGNESWLESSSIADSVRGLYGRLKASAAKMVGDGAGAGGSAGGSGGGIGSRIGGMFGGLFGGGGAGGGGAGMAAAGGSAGGAAMGVGLAAAGVIAAFVAIVAVVGIVVNSLYKLGMQGYETALRVSQFDGQLASAKAQLDVSRMMRDIQTARTLSESGAGFMRALDELEQKLRPLTDGALDISLIALTEIVLALTDAFEMMLKSIVLFLKIQDFFLGGAVPDAFIKKMDDIANGKQAAAIGGGQLGFFDGQMADKARRKPPRQQLPPMGGGNGPGGNGP